MKKPNLHIRIPFGKTFILALAILAFSIIAAETAFRTTPVQSVIPNPSLGISHYFLDLKFSSLRNETKKNGPVDCLFLGTSQVDVSFDPAVFSTSYEKRTGKRIRSYNFGVAGLMLPSTKALMHILIKVYKPRFIMLGIAPAQFGKEIIRPSEARIMSSHWIRYHNGSFNFEGWMTEHFMAYRYFLRFRQWMEQPEFSFLVSQREKFMSPYGFANFKNPHSVQALQTDPKRAARFKRKLASFEISPVRITDFEKLLDYRDQVDLAVVEMPDHPIFKTFYGGEEKSYLEVSEAVRRITERRGIVFIPADKPEFHADELWLQSNHMNALGAELFSLWLGDKVGEFVQAGLIKDPVS
ncbi:MAG: hypothetical protein JXB23_14650 [Candidatus Aminicenantes bacterium]|nr:hypothetical protein [Candidatus Aminicenantes bacterium]